MILVNKRQKKENGQSRTKKQATLSTRHIPKTYKAKNTTQKTKNMSNTDPNKTKARVNTGGREG